MPHLQVKRFAHADEVRALPKGSAQVVNLGEITVARASWGAGWRWSTDLAPIVGTKSCEVHHLGYSLSGALHVEMDDGRAIDVSPESIYEIPAGHDAWVVGDEPWVTVEWTSARFVGVAPAGPSQRVLATILFTDIVDSTVTLERVGDTAWRELLTAHNTRLRDQLNRFRGREVTTTGDGFLAVFDSPTSAVRCALGMVQSAGDMGLPIRAGVHTGEVEFIGTDARGIAVHAAARVMALAGADEVVISSTTNDLLDGSGLRVESAGSHELKGLTGPRQVFRVTTRTDASAP